MGVNLVKEQEEGTFPLQLIKELKENHIPIDESKMYGFGDDTTKHLLGALNAAEPSSNPHHPRYEIGDYDLVVLSIGMHDLYRGHSLHDYKYHFKELLNRSIRFAHNNPARVIVLSIPAWDVSPSVYNKIGLAERANQYEEVRHKMNEISIATNAVKTIKNNHAEVELDEKILRDKIQKAKNYNTPEGIAKSIDAFNAAAQDIIRRTNEENRGQGQIHYIDLTQITRQDAIDKTTGAPLPYLFASDGIHYSSQMYKRWADAVYPTAYQILRT
ncbi:MAG: hypothetical protein BGO43_15655 [Gammaproteobacteria bacterium 39-13]|nr:SGNH/GDSL hydrolase family protein [Gammaproteobacteria bacterium]OJV87843.1 MAG: hypothetical protein BGO43_15655 [Gammaproteobacteria bacterium 39-13]